MSHCQMLKTINSHEYADLGLSVNWATCNVGSRSPEDYGDYFAWGETYTKSFYNRMTYRFSGESNDFMSFSKYLGKSQTNTPGDSVLFFTDDVAHKQWGKPWRMPTKKEIKELVDSCNWSFDDLNGVKGCWAVSKVNGNKIFFPLAGYIYNDSIADIGKSGKYWASELRPDMCFEAYQLWLSYNDALAEMRGQKNVFLSDDGYREYGRTIRAVCNK